MQKEFYEYSLAACYDLGNLVGAPKLLLLEEILLFLGRIASYGVLIKLNAWKGVRQFALKGNIAAFSLMIQALRCRCTGPTCVEGQRAPCMFPFRCDLNVVCVCAAQIFL